jgi:hypothetical protein
MKKAHPALKPAMMVFDEKNIWAWKGGRDATQVYPESGAKAPKLCVRDHPSG